MAESTFTSDEYRAAVQKLVFEAGIQLAALSDMALAEMARVPLAENDGIKALVVRMRTLANVVLSSDDGPEQGALWDLHETVHGCILDKGVAHG